MRRVDLTTGEHFDGLGRVLETLPWWAQLIFTDEGRWAGLVWQLADAGIFFSAIGVIALLYKWADE